MDRKQQVEWSPVLGTEPRKIKGIWPKTKLEKLGVEKMELVVSINTRDEA